MYDAERKEGMRKSFSLVAVIVMLGGVLLSLRTVEASQYVELLLSQGIEEMGKGAYEKALEKLQRAAEQDPHNPDVHYFSGLAYSRLGNYPLAITAFKRVLELNPDDRRVHYEMGMAYFSMEDYSNAMDSFKRAHGDDPSNAFVLLYLGATYQRMGQHRQSIRYVRKAKKLDPKLAQLSEFYLGMAYMGLGWKKEAAEALQICIEMDPTAEVAVRARDSIAVIGEREKPEKRWDLSATLSFQYDDNVVLKPEGVTTAVRISDESDFRGVGFLWGEYRFLQGRHLLAGVRGSFYQSMHTSLHDYDVTDTAASLYWGYRGEVKGFPYKVEADYVYEYTWLDNRSYLERHSSIALFDFSETPYLLTQGTYRLQAKNYFNQPFLGPANDRDALNHRAGLTQYLFFSEQTRYIYGGYFFDLDDADGSNWDYDGHFFSLGFYTPLMYGIRLRLQGDYYLQDFDHTHTIYLKKRKDKELTGHVSVDRDFGKYLNLSAYYVHQDHGSNIDAFEYDRNIYFVSVTGRF